MKNNCQAGLLFVAILSLLCLAGCGGRGPTIHEITGTVTYKGKPVPNLVINFVPEKGRPSWGHTDDEGKYELHYNRDADGGVEGKHRVFLTYQPRDTNELIAWEEGRLEYSEAINQILEKYGSEEKSPLEFDLQGDSDEINLDLK